MPGRKIGVSQFGVSCLDFPKLLDFYTRVLGRSRTRSLMVLLCSFRGSGVAASVVAFSGGHGVDHVGLGCGFDPRLAVAAAGQVIDPVGVQSTTADPAPQEHAGHGWKVRAPAPQ